MTEDEKNNTLRVWEKTIDVQMHFNDIEIRIRNLFITVVLALTGSIGWVLEKDYSLDLNDSISINFSILLMFAGIIACYLFYLMDRHWYHNLLVGSVKQSLALDEKYGDKIPSLGLTTKISGTSPIIGFKKSYLAKFLIFFKILKVDKDTFDNDNLRSAGKLRLFYFVPIRILQFFLFLAFIFGGIGINGKSIFYNLFEAFLRNCGS